MSDAFEASLGKLVASAQRDHAEVADAERQARQRRLEAERAKAAAWQTHQAAFQEKIGSVLTPVWVTARRALTGNYHILSDRARIANDTDQWTYRLAPLTEQPIRQIGLAVELEATGLVRVHTVETMGAMQVVGGDHFDRRVPLQDLDQTWFEGVFGTFIRMVVSPTPAAMLRD